MSWMGGQQRGFVMTSMDSKRTRPYSQTWRSSAGSPAFQQHRDLLTSKARSPKRWNTISTGGELFDLIEVIDSRSNSRRKREHGWRSSPLGKPRTEFPGGQGGTRTGPADSSKFPSFNFLTVGEMPCHWLTQYNSLTIPVQQ